LGSIVLQLHSKQFKDDTHLIFAWRPFCRRRFSLGEAANTCTRI